MIEVTNLRKVYRMSQKEPGIRGTFKNLFHTRWIEKVAIDNVTFRMEEGDSLACIGENGAGKSTLIKMLIGILTPTEGTVRVYGKSPMEHHNSYLRRIGVIFGQKTSLWIDIPVIESYNAIQVLYKLDPALYKRNLDMVVELLELQPLLDSPARKLSLGQRMKADIGLVFLHSPEILYLDEPTIGLDINVKHAIRRFIRQMNRENKVSVLLTSHDLDDIDEICGSALVLSKGKKFFHGSLEELKHTYVTSKAVTVLGRLTGDIRAILPKAKITEDGRKTVMIYDSADYSSSQIMNTISSCFDVEDITIQEPGIDYVVSQIFTAGKA